MMRSPDIPDEGFKLFYSGIAAVMIAIFISWAWGDVVVLIAKLLSWLCIAFGVIMTPIGFISGLREVRRWKLRIGRFILFTLSLSIVVPMALLYFGYSLRMPWG